jgi:two-component SAPR family response regulator
MTNKEKKECWANAQLNTVQQIVSLFKGLSHIPKEYPWAKEAYEYLESIGLLSNK